MIDVYLTDIIKIITVQYDKYGNFSEIESGNIPARVEEYNKLVTNNEGAEVMANSLIMIKSNNDITFGDKIKIIKKNGKDFLLRDKLWTIKNIFNASGFTESYIEVYI